MTDGDWRQILADRREQLKESPSGDVPSLPDLEESVLDALSGGTSARFEEWLHKHVGQEPGAATVVDRIHSLRERAVAVLDGADAGPEAQRELRHQADELVLDAVRTLRETDAEGALEGRRVVRVGDLLSDVVYSRRRDGSLAFVSRSVEAVAGVTAEELCQQPGLWSELMVDEDRPRFEQEQARRTEEGGPGEVQYRIRHRGSGIEHTVLDRAVPRRDDAGEVERVDGVLVDLTLRTAVEENTARAERLQILGQMTGGVAHSFNNLLTVISGYASALEDAEGLDPMEQRAIVQIVSASDRAADATQRLVRYERGMPPRPQSIHVLPLLKEARELIRGMISRAIELKVVAQPDLPHVHGEPGQLITAILHLVANSREAMPQGGTLILGAYRARDEDDQVILEIRDDGLGMPGNVLDRLFEPYFTTHEADRDDAAGLGCAQARAIIEDHGGTLTITSTVGEGTRAVIRLPAEPAR